MSRKKSTKTKPVEKVKEEKEIIEDKIIKTIKESLDDSQLTKEETEEIEEQLKQAIEDGNEDLSGLAELIGEGGDNEFINDVKDLVKAIDGIYLGGLGKKALDKVKKHL